MEEQGLNNVDELLARLRRLGVRLAVDGDNLKCNAPKGVLTPELQLELRTHKEAIKTRLGTETGQRGRPTGPVPVARRPLMPLSDAQQRLWFFRQMDSSSAAYNVYGVLRLVGKLDVGAVEEALRTIVQRHETLRTRFVAVKGEPRAEVEAQVDWHLDRFDCEAEAEQDREAEAMQRVAAVCSRPFDYEQCPLFRAEVVRLSPEEHILVLVVDHIVADGWSAGVLVRDFIELYSAAVTGAEMSLPELPLQFMDFAEWQRARLADGLLDDKLPACLAKLGGTLPVLQLPTDRPRPPVQRYRGSRVFSKYPVELVDSLKALARREGVTFFMLLLAAFKTLLSRYSSMEDIIVGSAMANRELPETERVIGFFVNNLVLRTDLSGNPTVLELLERVKATALDAYAHQDVPFDLLVEKLRPRRELDHSPLFQAMFVLQNLPFPNITLPGLEFITMDEPVDIGTSRFDLSIDAFDRPEGLKMYLEYDSDLFDRAAMSRMLDHLRVLLEGFVAHPESRIGDLSMLSAEESRQLIEQWNPPASEYPRDACIHELFEARAREMPDREALVHDGSSLSYGELNERANRLAHHLTDLGLGPGKLAGVWLDRSEDMVVALLAVLKAGGGYVPLDPAFPQDRIEYMLQDSGLSILVTDAGLGATLAGPGSIRVVELDTEAAQIAARPGTELPASASATDIAYVIYTSGSTGKPKGVEIEHRAFVNFILSMLREPGIDADDRLLAVTTISFDIAGLELFGPLTAGGCVILADRETALDGQRLAALIETSGATMMQATPASWRLLLEGGRWKSTGLKILCGGEALPRELADRLLATGGELWNLYGPTETTVWSTVARVRPGPEHPWIGKPIANTRVYILDAARQPVPVGVPGELYIGGEGLARGYLGRPELTAERFVPDPFAAEAGARMYRTGDLARWRADGSLHCLGRADNQVKIRGYRVEPGEIEAALARHAAVDQAVVVARPDASGEHRLIAYLVSAARTGTEPAELRRFLAETLPEYMIPSAFVSLDELPKTPNGKVDRKALPDPDYGDVSTGASYAAPVGETELAVASIWQGILNLEKVGRHDNFFDLGGHSLLIVQVQNRIQGRLGMSVNLVDLFRHPTVSALASFLESGNKTADRVARARERAERQRAVRVQR